MQDDLVTLSRNAQHRFLANATHDMVVGDEATAREASKAIVDVVAGVRGARPATARQTRPVDELVAIDGGKLHLRCVGQGDETLLLIAGWDSTSATWSKVEPDLAQRGRVCSYDRFGTGTSDAPSMTQTFATQVGDLHALLDAAGEPGPYVVVGHSFGGAEAVTFASTYRDEVRGLMIVDASATDWPATVCSVAVYDAGCALMHDPMRDGERLDVFPAFEGVAAITSLGNLPMTVMTAAHRTAPELPASELARIEAVWAAGTQRWAQLSSSSTVVSVDDTGHDIQVDQPAIVIAEALKLLPT